MKRTFTQVEKDHVFSYWKQGQGFSDIGRTIGAKPGSVFTILREHGGIQPAPRKRAKHHLTAEEREEIRAGLSAKKSFREIASILNRAPSTIFIKMVVDVGTKLIEPTGELGDKQNAPKQVGFKITTTLKSWSLKN